VLSAPDGLELEKLDSAGPGRRPPGLVSRCGSADAAEDRGKHENQAGKAAQLPCRHLSLLE
jgi:hypothetical protein